MLLPIFGPDTMPIAANGHGALWHALNSQAVLTLVTVGVGGLLAAWLTAKWQRSSGLFDTRIDAIEKLLEQHKALGGALEKGDLDLDKGSVYQVNLSLAFLRALFPGRTERAAVKSYYEKLKAAIDEPLPEKRIELGKSAGTQLGELLSALVKCLGIKK